MISISHDKSGSSHFGDHRTDEFVCSGCDMPAMYATERKYIAKFEPCHRIMASQHTHHGTNMLQPLQSYCWERVSMDFVTKLTESTGYSRTRTVVVINRLMKIANVLPCRNDIHQAELAWMGFMYVSCDHYAPGNIVTDHGKVFTSRCWKRVCSYLSVNRRLSTAFYPQTDGQTEWQNQTM